MPKKAKPCAYCGVADAREREHVFPDSWYPETTPDTVQRLTVPSCPTCNDRWEEVERAFADELVFVTSRNVPEAAGVHQRLERAWRAAPEHGPRERGRRIARANRILHTMAWADPVPGGPQAIVRTRSGLYVRASPVRKVENWVLRSIAEKFVRGLHYGESRGEILPDLAVVAFWYTPEMEADGSEFAPGVAMLRDVLSRMPIRDLGPGFWYRHHDEPQMSAWAFRIWGQVTVGAFVRKLSDPVYCGA